MGAPLTKIPGILTRTIKTFNTIQPKRTGNSPPRCENPWVTLLGTLILTLTIDPTYLLKILPLGLNVGQLLITTMFVEITQLSSFIILDEPMKMVLPLMEHHS